MLVAYEFVIGHMAEVQSRPLRLVVYLLLLSTANGQQYVVEPSLEESEQCYQKHLDWKSRVRGLETDPSITTTHYFTTLYQTLKPVGNGISYSCQDGIPRFQLTSTRSLQTSSFSFIKTEYRATYLPYVSEEPPTCSVNSQLCSKILRSYEADRLRAPNEYHPLPGFGWDRLEGGVHVFPPGCPEPLKCHFINRGYIGNNVRLLFWPPAESSKAVCGLQPEMEPVNKENDHVAPSITKPRTFTTDAITFPGWDSWYMTATETILTNGQLLWSGSYSNDLEAVRQYTSSSMLYGNFTFVEPKKSQVLYLAHHPISVAIGNRYCVTSTAAGVQNITTISSLADETGDCMTWSQLLPAGILTVDVRDVYSLRPKIKPEESASFAYQVAQGQFGVDRSMEIEEEVVQLNIAHLLNPVPASEYFNARPDCWGRQTHCATITADTHAPRLYIHPRVWQSLLPKRLGLVCPGHLLEDPPLELPGGYATGDILDALAGLSIPRPIAQINHGTTNNQSPGMTMGEDLSGSGPEFAMGAQADPVLPTAIFPYHVPTGTATPGIVAYAPGPAPTTQPKGIHNNPSPAQAVKDLEESLKLSKQTLSTITSYATGDSAPTNDIDRVSLNRQITQLNGRIESVIVTKDPSHPVFNLGIIHELQSRLGRFNNDLENILEKGQQSGTDEDDSLRNLRDKVGQLNEDVETIIHSGGTTGDKGGFAGPYPAREGKSAASLVDSDNMKTKYAEWSSGAARTLSTTKQSTANRVQPFLGPLIGTGFIAGWFWL
ncbi:hypothetical protein BT63DRAFT_418048 [Microthyrium microscopicum]|uniref:Uncharacterized protein n=1 Tax=Microthyrium microscopicum TaxID=703497 RepID=A0A6A6U0D3_9PEZI|nr:hypothetical protein BT63DRAFT_418048 [Microthyrium microscopicum]